MFKDEEKYKAYLKKQQVSVLDIDAYNFFQHSKSGEIILNDFDLNKAIDDAKKTTNIDIPESVQNYYARFLGERYCELKNAYKEYISTQQNEKNEEKNIER